MSKEANERTDDIKVVKETATQQCGSRKSDSSQGKGRKRRRNNKSSNNQRSVNGHQKSNSINDPALYNKYPVILNQAGKVNNYHPVGLVGTEMFGNLSDKINITPIPGICTMDIIPALPVSSSGDSTLQQASYLNWTMVRDAISGSRKYDPVDLQLMSIAVSQVVACATWLHRFFNFAYTMSPYNRYAPERLFNAMHCDYDDFLASLPAYRARYNRITINLSRVYANTNNNYHKMLRSLFETVYTEGGDNGQLYLYNPVGFYSYSWVTDTQGVTVGGLKFLSIKPGAELGSETIIDGQDVFTFDKLLDVYNTLVNNLITDSDVNDMSGDILKTYGPSSQIVLPLALENEGDTPRYSTMDLSQFMMSFVPLEDSKFTSFGTITQTDAHYIQFAPKYEIGRGSIPQMQYDTTSDQQVKARWLNQCGWVYQLMTQRNRILLNDYVDLNVPMNVAEMCRNIPIFDNYSDADFKDLVLKRAAKAGITLNIKSTTGILPVSITVFYMGTAVKIQDIGLINVESLIRNFTFLPMRVIYHSQVATGDGFVNGVRLDANLNDYYSVDRARVIEIQDAMALSMFADL